MLSPEDKVQQDVERTAFRQWWAGERSQPFVLQRRENYCVCDVLFPSFFAQRRMEWRGLANWIIEKIPFSPFKIFGYRLLGVRIGRNVFIAPSVVLDPFYLELIELEDDCFLDMGCRLVTHEYTATFFRMGRIKIGKGAVIGGWATIRAGVTVGAKSTVGFNSFVNKDVPDSATVAGAPATVLSKSQSLP